MTPVLAAVLSLCLGNPSEPNHMPYRIERDERGVYWFASDTNDRFLSLGVDNVSPEPFRPKPGTRYYDAVRSVFGGSHDLWSQDVLRMLGGAGFNTLGAWSDERIPASEAMLRTPVLYVAGHNSDRPLEGLRPGFASRVRHNMAEVVAKLPDRKHILGVFLDNEAAWFGRSGWDEIPNYTLLEVALGLDAADPARGAAMEFLKSRHGDAAEFGRAWGVELDAWDQLSVELLRQSRQPVALQDREAFTALAAERYFAEASAVVRAEFPGTLILGCRFSGNAPEGVIRACAKHCDAISFNSYDGEPKANQFLIARYWLLGAKPLMITEFSWRSRENLSGNPNTRGAGAVVDTRARRAANYEAYVTDCLRSPVVIGMHWFEFADQSPDGRFDGEDGSYGIVSIRHEPYTELLESMAKTNARVEALHASTDRLAPSEIPTPAAATYEPGQHPGRPPVRSILQSPELATRPPEVWSAPDASLSLSRNSEGLEIVYDAGGSWGGGVNLYGPIECRVEGGPDFATDLDGYTNVVAHIDAPKGLQINLFINEAGVDVLGAARFDVGCGDDGESFVSPPVFGTGKLEVFTIPIRSFRAQVNYGNQSGNKRIQMHAVRSVALQLQGTPSKGTVRVLRLELVR